MNELLSCEALTKCYQKDKTALENVDLHIGFGHIVGLLGPNGSGKTTLIKLANGLLQPSAGSIRIAGMTPGPDTKAIVSYLPDADWLPDWILTPLRQTKCWPGWNWNRRRGSRPSPRAARKRCS